MADYEKYICTTLHKRHLLPGPKPEERDMLAADGLRIKMEHILWVDEDIIPGAYYNESAWIWPSSYPGQITPDELAKRTTPNAPMFPHVHDVPEILSWWGTNLDDPEDTSSMGMIMGDEEVMLDKSWVAYIPAGMMHMPTKPAGGRVTDKPVWHWTFAPGMYTREKEVHEEDAKHTTDLPRPGAPKKNTKESLKYFVFAGDQKDIKRPDFMMEINPEFFRHIACIDEKIIPGCELGCDTFSILPGDTSKSGIQIMDPHASSHGTIINLTSLNYDSITDLAAEAELWIGGEKHIITKGFGVYIPPNVEQGPLVVRNVKKQLFFMMSFPVGEGIKKFPGGK
ncbi:MAG: hypothetical protein JW864_09885 [Spirochaetes bacterium]|nr:hypothetical protein [Spirochaetota bacterium]